MIPFLVFIVACVVVGHMLRSILAKAGNKDTEPLVWIPIAQVVPMFQTAGMELWKALLLLIPLVNLVIIVLVWMNILKLLKIEPMMAILMIIPLVNLAYMVYLAYFYEVPQTA